MVLVSLCKNIRCLPPSMDIEKNLLAYTYWQSMDESDQYLNL